MLHLKIYWNSRIARTAADDRDGDHIRHGDNSDAELAAFERMRRKETPFRPAF